MNLQMRYWLVYVTVNYVGSFLCLLLVVSVVRLRHKTTSDLLAAALSTSCAIMSLTCGTQCLLNVVQQEFAYGKDACYAEAFFHLIAIVTMFFILTLSAYDSYYTVTRGKSLGLRLISLLITGCWMLSALGVGLYSLNSPIYLSSTGLFCFFAFDSMLMYGFFLPAFLVAAGAMCYWYCRIFNLTTGAAEKFASNTQRQRLQQRLARKLFLLVVIFVAGWAVLVAGIVVELVTGQMYQLDGVGGVLGVCHSLAVPCAYGLINPRLQQLMLQVLTCGQYTRTVPTESINTKIILHTPPSIVISLPEQVHAVPKMIL